MQQENKDRIIAGTITAVVVALILVFLFVVGIGWDKAALSQSSIPEEQSDEELFLDPELLDLGETQTDMIDAPAPSEIGEPELAEQENPEPVVKGENPKPTPPQEKIITQSKDSPVKKTEPNATDRELKKVTSTVANSFSAKNGKTDGKFNSSGSGTTGVGVTGSARGRSFIGCPKPVVELTRKTTVVVNIQVDEDGKVISASAGGSANADIRRKCEQAAMQATWSKKPGSGITPGTITFTITPV